MKLLLRVAVACYLTAVLSLSAWGGMPTVLKNDSTGIVLGPPTTFDPANLGPEIAISGGNLIVNQLGADGGGYPVARSITSHSTGKYYVEFTLNSNFAAGADEFGITTSAASLDPTALGFDANLSTGVFDNTTSWYINSSPTGSSINCSVGNTTGIAIDAGAQLVWQRCIVSGSPSNWNNSGTANPATGAGGVSISAISGPYYAAVAMLGNQTSQITGNFGALPYQSAAPSGFGNW
jgi:hypothetical protein